MNLQYLQVHETQGAQRVAGMVGGVKEISPNMSYRPNSLKDYIGFRVQGLGFRVQGLGSRV